MLGSRTVVRLQFVLVLDDLPVQLVDQFIDGGIKVFVAAFGKQVVALDADATFSALPFLLFLLVFDRKQHLDVHHLVEMPVDPVQLAVT